MKIIKIVSEWKKHPSMESMQKNGFVGPHEKMVEAIVEIDGQVLTRHLKVRK